MKRAIFLTVLTLGGCADSNALFTDLGPGSGGNGTAGTAGVGDGSGGALSGMSPGGSMIAGGGTTVGGSTTTAGSSTTIVGGSTTTVGGSTTTVGVSTTVGGSLALGGGVAAGGSPATGGDLASGGTDINGAGAGAAEAGETSGGAPLTTPESPLHLIDDMEGAFPSLPVREGRDGAWFAANDGSDGYITGPNAISLVPARGSSHVAAGLSGGGFTGWGAQLGVSLTANDDSYDASAFCGVHFWARGNGAGWTLLVGDHSSMPQGGVCDLNDFSGDNACYRFVGKGLPLSNAWREIVVSFDALRLLADPNSPRRLETAQIYDILFNFYGNGDAFELQVDDLSFIEAGSTLCP